MMTQYRVILLPKKDTWQQFYTVVAPCEPVSKDYLLSPARSVPHLTLMRFNGEESTVSDVWEGIKETAIVSVTMGGIKVVPNKTGEKSFAYIDVNKGDLSDVKKVALKAVASHTADFSNKEGDKYLPRISLAIANLSAEAVREKLGALFFQEGIKMPFDIAIGESDYLGQISKIVRFSGNKSEGRQSHRPGFSDKKMGGM